ncbi:MAG TPA: hypothetical protein VLC09_20530 [Polyangiaceae bacterium]|nr:hypothetical protein [Polyangiaceae bacterium]
MRRYLTPPSFESPAASPSPAAASGNLQQFGGRADGWLALVGETAGVGDCGVTRVSFAARPNEGNSVATSTNSDPTNDEWRVCVQVFDGAGCVVGTAAWSGDAATLAEGAALDVGFCADASPAHHVTVWLEATARSLSTTNDDSPFELESEAARPPAWAASRPLGDGRPIDLSWPVSAPPAGRRVAARPARVRGRAA